MDKEQKIASAKQEVAASKQAKTKMEKKYTALEE